jgi:gamma-butyrobetaine dioxygenase
MTVNSAPTPDFYSYRWQPLASVTVDGQFVVLQWPDGLELRAYQQWLAENVVGDTIDSVTRESVFDPADMPADRLAAPTLDAEVRVDHDGALTIAWEPTGPPARYHPGWLRHVAEGLHLPSAGLPPATPWTSADFDQPPTTDLDLASAPVPATLDSSPSIVAALDRWVDDLVRFGLARLERTPLDPEFLGLLGRRIGAIRDTNFGLVWDVKADVEPNSTANTNLRLCPHTDLPTRETPPGFQFLHCVANTVNGGWSTMVDGMAVVDHLRETEPDHYEALTTLRWVFFNRGRSVDHRWSGPIIDLGGPQSPLTIRAFHPVRGFPDMAHEDQPRAYAALRQFSKLTADRRFQISFPYRPGDLVGFDNRRILHGRDAYETSGHRHLRGIYIDHDEVYSHARLRAREREAGQAC